MQCDGEYLKEGPRSLLKSCDIVLQLDDGAELPAHSQVLARCSGVFLDMLAGGPLSSTSPGHRITLPFSDCSKEEAVRFLSAVYSSEPDKHIDEASALSIAKLGHKYGTQDIVKLCDDALSQLAGINRGPPFESSYLQGKSHEDFVYILDSALSYDMPKLLACCEHHIAIDSGYNGPSWLQRIQPDLLRLIHLLPGDSTLRIADSLRKAFWNMAAETASRKGRCECLCCVRTQSGNYHSNSGSKPSLCTCTIRREGYGKLSKYVPGPKNFLACQ